MFVLHCLVYAYKTQNGIVKQQQVLIKKKLQTMKA